VCCTKASGSGAVANATIYINGSSDTVTASDTLGTATTLGTAPMTIAKWYKDPDIAGGDIDDVGVWNRELTSVEVASIYTNKTRCHKVQRSDLVAYYDFDYVGGSLASVDSATGFVGIKDRTTNDFKMWFPGFEYGQFGDGEWMETPYNASYNFAKDEAFSVCGWILGNDLSNWYNVVLGNLNTGGGANWPGWTVHGSSSGNKIQLHILDDGGARMIVETSALLADRWYHVCCTKAAANAIASLNIYVNGVLDRTVPGASAATLTGTVTSPVPLSIGNYYNYATTYQWEGQIHDVGIWDIELDTTAITALAVADTRVNTVQAANLVGGWTFPIRSKGAGLAPEVDISGNGLDMMVET
jgi:hypothetical protein